MDILNSLSLSSLSFINAMAELKPGSSYILVLIFGLFTSIHCIGMCGGLVLSQSISNMSEDEDGAVKTSGKRRFFGFNGRQPSDLAIYNLGRLISYMATGLVAGGMGTIINLPLGLQWLVPLVGGIFLVVMGLNLAGIFPFLRYLNPRLPLFAIRIVNSGRFRNPFTIGLLSALMPCAPLQIAQLYALSTGSVLKGVFSMFLFSVGTIPALYIFGSAGSSLNKKNSLRLVKVSALVVLIMGVSMIGRGVSLSGIDIGYASRNYQDVTRIPKNLKIARDVQYVETQVHLEKFDEITVRKGIPVVWTIKAAAKDLDSCSETFMMPAFKIKTKITEGKNIIKFKPEKAGDYVYCSWCAMIKSKIHVID